MGNCVVDGEAPISPRATASDYTSLSALLCERQHSVPAVDSVPAEVNSAQILQSVLEANPTPADLQAAISISAAPLRGFFASPSDQLSLAVRDWLGLHSKVSSLAPVSQTYSHGQLSLAAVALFTELVPSSHSTRYT